MKSHTIYDVVIAGGGPAAISAAVLLGRCMRSVLLCGASHPELDSLQNPERVFCCPSEFLRSSRIQLNRLDTTSTVRTSVRGVSREHRGFLVKCENGGSFVSKALLLASDFVARVPDISGVRNYLGHSLHQCPYSDAWEHRGKLIGVIGNDDAALNLALTLLTWSPRVTLYTRGGKLGNSEQIRLQGSPVEVVTGSIRVLEGHGRRLESIRMENGFTYPCDALFYPAAVRSHAKLAERIGGNLSLHALSGGKLPRGSSGIEGLFFTGERQDGLEMAVSAAAAGVAAAEAIDHWLVEAERSYLALPTQHPDRISSW